MMNKNDDKIANPLDYYEHPAEVDRDNELSVEDKVKLLTNWLDDIKLRQTAEEENMPPADDSRFYAADVEHLLHKYQAEQLGKKED